jgi:hypothetical protein
MDETLGFYKSTPSFVNGSFSKMETVSTPCQYYRGCVAPQNMKQPQYTRAEVTHDGFK